MNISYTRIARLVSMIAYKEALDHQMDVLESEIIQTDHQDIKRLLTEELLRVTSENLRASRDIFNMSRALELAVVAI